MVGQMGIVLNNGVYLSDEVSAFLELKIVSDNQEHNICTITAKQNVKKRRAILILIMNP
jgi:hypothetical protein